MSSLSRTHTKDPILKAGAQAALGNVEVSQRWIKAPFGTEKKKPKCGILATSLQWGLVKQEVRGGEGRGRGRRRGKGEQSGEESWG